MALTKSLVEIFRDFETDGVPASGKHKPIKADIRQWGTEVEAELALAATRVVTAAGAITVLVDDRIIIIDRTVAEVAAINMPSVALATGEIEIIDGAGVFDAFTQTVTPNGTDLVSFMATYPLTGQGSRTKFKPYVRAGQPDQWLVSAG